jgi:hypothetical protein
MKIAFRKNDTSIISKLIRWWTKSPYSHCEIIFSNGQTFSAFIEERKTSMKTKVYSDNSWDIIELPIDKEAEYMVYEWCMNEMNCGYDFIGIIFSQIIKLSRESKEKWFCSEVCCAALQQANLAQGVVPHEVSPGALYVELVYPK